MRCCCARSGAASLARSISAALEPRANVARSMTVGGGSSIDTAKAVDLLTTNPGELMDYVNPPVGAGRAPENQLKPLVAVPTTTGTGAESTKKARLSCHAAST